MLERVAVALAVAAVLAGAVIASDNGLVRLVARYAPSEYVN